MTIPAQAEQIPSLMQLLLQEYKAVLETHNRQVQKDPSAGRPVDVQKELDRASGFRNFADAYLDQNRVTESFPVDRNLGIRLGSNMSCCISPGGSRDVSGTMQEANDVPITSGRSPVGHYREMETPGGSVPITGDKQPSVGDGLAITGGQAPSGKYPIPGQD